MSEPSAVPVAVHGFTWGAAACWSTFLALMGVIATLMRAGAIDGLKEWNRARKEKRDDDRIEEVSDKAQIAVLNDRMTRMSGAFAFLANAITVAVNGLAADDQRTRDNSAGQARELVAMAVSTLGNEDPFVKALDRVASINRSTTP